MKGIIRACGSKAITIQTEQYQQFYGPLEDISEDLLKYLDTDILRKTAVLVTFDVDYSQYSGEIRGKKRYYANNVKLDYTIII